MPDTIVIFLIFAFVSARTSPATHHSFLAESTYMNWEMLFLEDTPAHLTGQLSLLTLDQMGSQSAPSDLFMTKFTFNGDQLTSGFVAKKFSFK
jgi:hypothetical protein